MTFTFSKSYLSNYQSEDAILYKRLRLYYVYKDNNLFGQYFGESGKQFFVFTGKKYKIESNKKWYKNPHYKIIDEGSEQIIGEYLLTNTYNDTFNHYPEVPYTNPYLKLIVGGKEFEFRRQKPEIEYWLFDSSTWGHYSFGLYDKQNHCAVNYIFKIEKPLLDGSIIFNNNLEGTIETNQDNSLLLFAGLFLLERFFDDQDRSG